MDIFRQTKYKRLIVIALVTLAGILLASCMAPQFSYQGVLTDASGNPYNGQVTITYRIYNSETGGTEIYDQTETVTVIGGRFDSVVGPDTAAAGLAPKDLAQPLWIEVQIDNGTYVETLTPRQKLYGAPYAFTLMPGAVISATMDTTLIGAAGFDAVASVVNMEVSDPLPALRVIGQQGIELVDVSGSHGTIYSDQETTSSDIYMYSNDDFAFFLDNDNNGVDGQLWVYGRPTTNYCVISYLGGLHCTGPITSSSLMNGETRSLYTIESPDVRNEDFGSSQLSKGTVTVQVDALFAQSVNLNMDYHVFVTPLGDCNGLFVTNKTTTGFEVYELGGGTSNVSFDYRIVAKRAGYEDLRMEVAPVSDEGIGR